MAESLPLVLEVVGLNPATTTNVASVPTLVSIRCWDLINAAFIQFYVVS